MTAQPDRVGSLPEAPVIDAIISATGRDRQRLIDDFMRSKLQAFRSIGLKLCRIASMDVRRHADEASSIVAAEAVVMLNELINHPERLARLQNFDYILFTRARAPFRTYSDGAAGGVNASGAVALARRMREMGRTREALRAELDREPTNGEIVEATNARMIATRKDPKRQSMLCSVEDLQSDPVAYSLCDQDIAQREEDSLLAPHEAGVLIAKVIAVATGTSPVLGRVATAWLGDLYNPKVATIRTVSQVASLLDMKEAAVSRALAQIRVVARSYLAEFLSITEVTYQGGDFERYAADDQPSVV